MTIKFDVLNRWTGGVQFTADIDCAADALPSVKLCLAVRWAVKAGANLAGAKLAGAKLTDANLAYANLTGANLAYDLTWQSKETLPAVALVAEPVSATAKPRSGPTLLTSPAPGPIPPAC
mgnify:CR=1 FL=1